VPRLVALVLFAVVGCAFAPPPPVAHVRRGPAFGQWLTPLAAMPVVCGRTTMGCLPGYLAAVASATRISLEYGGYRVVDTERINAELQQRSTHTVETIAGERVETEVTGVRWLDLPPEQQRALLIGLGIKGVFRAVISMGIPHGMAAERTVTATIAITRLVDEQVVVQVDCSVPTGDQHSEAQAVELATRCALESATLW